MVIDHSKKKSYLFFVPAVCALQVRSSIEQPRVGRCQRLFFISEMFLRCCLILFALSVDSKPSPSIDPPPLVLLSKFI